MHVQNVKLDGKTLSGENLEMIGQAATADQLKGVLTLTAAAPLVLPEDDTEVLHMQTMKLGIL